RRTPPSIAGDSSETSAEAILGSRQPRANPEIAGLQQLPGRDFLRAGIDSYSLDGKGGVAQGDSHRGFIDSRDRSRTGAAAPLAFESRVVESDSLLAQHRERPRLRIASPDQIKDLAG